MGSSATPLARNLARGRERHPLPHLRRIRLTSRSPRAASTCPGSERAAHTPLPYGRSTPAVDTCQAISASPRAWQQAAGIFAGPLWRAVHRNGQTVLTGRLTVDAIADIITRLATTAGFEPTGSPPTACGPGTSLKPNATTSPTSPSCQRPTTPGSRASSATSATPTLPPRLRQVPGPVATHARERAGGSRWVDDAME